VPLAEGQIAAVAGTELVEHVVEGGAPDPHRRLVPARGGEELASRAERHRHDRSAGVIQSLLTTACVLVIANRLANL
jgi:hypothetical protein